MRTRSAKLLALLGMMLSWSVPVHAGVYCVESITNAILHANGSIYFTTNLTCGSWCQVNWGTDAKNKNGYAMLLTALASGKNVGLYWPNIASCATANATVASPDYMVLVN